MAEGQFVLLVETNHLGDSECAWLRPPMTDTILAEIRHRMHGRSYRSGGRDEQEYFAKSGYDSERRSRNLRHPGGRRGKGYSPMPGTLCRAAHSRLGMSELPILLISKDHPLRFGTDTGADRDSRIP